MKHFITSDNIIITNLDRLELDDLSINIPRSYTIYSYSKCTVSSSSNNLIHSIDDNGNIVLSNVVEVDANKSFTILFESSDVKTDSCTITSIFSDTEDKLVFELSIDYIDVVDRLVVLLNNYGIQVTDEWVKCFYESDIHENEIDIILKNRKSSEFLLEFLNLVGLRGTYKTLFSAVSYFGYKNLVWFEEHWVSKTDTSIKRYTTINSEFMDPRLTNEGFNKIGDMTMFYALDMLDSEEPYDEGGIPNYIRNNISFDDLYYKLLLLRKILNNSFIPWDAYIVDIVGELRAVSVTSNMVWINNDSFLNQDEEQRYDFIDITFPTDIVYISEHKLILHDKLYNVNNNSIELVDDEKAHIIYPIVKIEKLDDELNEQLDAFDIITKFQRLDVAVIEPTITFKLDELNNMIPSWVNGFMVELFRKSETGYDRVYASKILSYTEFINVYETRLGIREIGEYMYIISIYDAWGYRKQFKYDLNITYDNVITNFKLYSPRYINDINDYKKRFMHFISTYETIDKSQIPVIDAAYTNNQIPAIWDINKDKPTDVRYINRYYTAEIDNVELLQPISKYATVKLSECDKLPLNEYYTAFDFIALDILKDGTTISLKTFSHNEYITIEYKNDLQFIHDLVEHSKQHNSPYSFFDFDIENLNTVYTKRLNIDENEKSKQMLLIYSRLKSFSLDKVIFRIKCGDEVLTNDPYTQGELKWYERNIKLFDRKLTLYTTSESANVLIVDQDTLINTYYNYIYPTFGCDAMVRINRLYNTNETGYYVYPILAEAGRTGILTWYHKNLTFGGKILKLFPEYGDYGFMNIDYNLRIRVGDIWFNSEQEFGKPIYTLNTTTNEYDITYETLPLSFTTLKKYIDKNDPSFTNELNIPSIILDNIEVMYNDNNLIIRVLNGYDIEIVQMNIGHKYSSSRIGAISKMYNKTIGTEFQKGSVIIAMPDNDIKINYTDIKWEIIDYITKNTVFTSNGYALKWVTYTPGIYNIVMNVKDKYSNYDLSIEKIGCILIK